MVSLSDINATFALLNKTEVSVRQMVRELLIEKLSGTSEYNPLVVDIFLKAQDDELTPFTPHLTEMWLHNNDIIFVIDDVDTDFDNVYAVELYYIVNQL